MSGLENDEQLWYDGLLNAGRQYDSLHLFLICTISSRNIKHEVLTSKKHHEKFTRIYSNLKSILNMKRKCEGPNKLLLVKN